MRLLTVTMLILGLAGSAALSGPAFAQGGGRPPPTLVGNAVSASASSETTPVVGRFIALRGGPIAARTAGAVDQVLVEVGDPVSEGQPLIRLALDRLTAERARQAALVAFSRARIRSANASFKLAEQNATRLSRLRKSAAFSEALMADKQREAERAAAQVKEAEADLARARADLKLADVALAYGEVRAPYAGVITERHVDVGGFVALGAPVVTMIGDRALEIETEAPTDRIGALRPGVMAQVTHRGVTASVPVRAVLPRETGVSRTRTVRLGPLPANLAAVAIANATLSLNIPVGAAGTALTVAKDAIVRRPTGATVVVAKPNPEAEGVYIAEPRPVQLGEAVGDRLVVVSGLKVGEIVVVRGNESIRPGQPFKLAPKPGG